MKEQLKQKLDELGIGGIVVAIVMLCACTFTAIWLAKPFLSGVTGILSFIFLGVIYLLILGIVLMPIVMLSGFIGNILGFVAEGIVALRNHYKRA